MWQQSSHQSVAPVLFQYDLYPEKIEHFGKVKKIVTRRGVFALKETTMNKEQSDLFIHVMRRLEKINYRQVVPLLPTKYGDFTVVYGNKTYYLLPWFEDEPQLLDNKKEQQLFQQLGKLHGLTEKQQKFSKEAIENSYQSQILRWDKRRLSYERFAEEVERKIYMSPFELTFITHFQKLMILCDEASHYLKGWFDQCTEKESYRTVLCHGKLDRTHMHFHSNGYGYLFNFEKAVLDTPARDLAISFRKSFQFSLWDHQQGAKWFHIYENFFSLTEEEKKLFAGYLIFPETVFKCVDHYHSRDGAISELQYVQILEKRLVTMSRVHQFIKHTLLQSKNSQPTES